MTMELEQLANYKAELLSRCGRRARTLPTTLRIRLEEAKGDKEAAILEIGQLTKYKAKLHSSCIFVRSTSRSACSPCTKKHIARGGAVMCKKTHTTPPMKKYSY